MLDDFFDANGYEHELTELLFSNTYSRGDVEASEEFAFLISEESQPDPKIKAWVKEYESTMYETVDSDNVYRLWQLWRDTESDFHESVQFNIVYNSECPDEILDEIARQGDPQLLDLVAGHEKLSAKTGVYLAKTYPNIHESLVHRTELSTQIGDVIAVESDSQSILLQLYRDIYHSDHYRFQMAGRDKPLPDQVQEFLMDVDYYDKGKADQARQLISSQSVNPAIAYDVLNRREAWDYAGIQYTLAENPIFGDRELYELFRRNHIEIMDFKDHQDRGRSFARYEHAEWLAQEKERTRIAFQTQQSKMSMTVGEATQGVSGMEMN